MVSKTIGAFEAKTHFSRLLEQAEKGDKIIITRRGKPVAELTSIKVHEAKDKRLAIEAIFELRSRLEDKYGSEDTLSVREMIEMGRK